MTTITLRQMLDWMGSEASDAEAEAMLEILAERGIETPGDVSDMSDDEFDALIPEAIKRARMTGRRKTKTTYLIETNGSDMPIPALTSVGVELDPIDATHVRAVVRGNAPAWFEQQLNQSPAVVSFEEVKASA